MTYPRRMRQYIATNETEENLTKCLVYAPKKEEAYQSLLKAYPDVVDHWVVIDLPQKKMDADIYPLVCVDYTL